MLEGKQDQVDGLVEAHDESGHVRLGEGDRIALADLVNPEGNN